MKTGRATSAAYTDLTGRLAPRGVFFDALRARGQVWSMLMQGQAKEAARAHNRLHDALLELDPATATETLPTWEGMTGLPDVEHGLTVATDTATRRAQVATKLIFVGSVNPARFVKLAKALGADVGVCAPWKDSLPHVDSARCGDLLEEDESAFYYLVWGTCPVAIRARLEATFAITTPAHVVCVYDYE